MLDGTVMTLTHHNAFWKHALIHYLSVISISSPVIHRHIKLIETGVDQHVCVCVSMCVHILSFVLHPPHIIYLLKLVGFLSLRHPQVDVCLRVCVCVACMDVYVRRPSNCNIRHEPPQPRGNRRSIHSS